MNDGIPYILFFIPTEQNRYITPFIINKLLHNGRTHPTTPSLLFSAVSLIMLAYTNRFLSYAQVVRTLKKDYDTNPSIVTATQIDNLTRRLYLTRSMQILGISSLLTSVICMLFLYIHWRITAVITFGVSLLCLILSLFLSIRELMISTHALENVFRGNEKMKCYINCV